MEWIEETQKRFQRIKPILTPRFIPTCSDDLMKKLADIQEKISCLCSRIYQRIWEKWIGYRNFARTRNFMGKHITNLECLEINIRYYGALCTQYGRRDAVNGRTKCIYCTLSSVQYEPFGVAPIRKYLDMGMKMGLGSDVAGGFDLSILRAMADAIQVSKLRWRLLDTSLTPLKVEEAFYLATKGGGEFFGKVGSFEEGYEFDAVVLDDSHLRTMRELDVKDRVERIIYLADEGCVVGSI